MADIEHAPERIAVPTPVPHHGSVAYPATDKDPATGNEVEYVRGDLLRGAVEALWAAHSYVGHMAGEGDPVAAKLYRQLDRVLANRGQ